MRLSLHRSLAAIVLCTPTLVFAAKPRPCVTADQAAQMLNKDICVSAHIYDVVSFPTAQASSTSARRRPPTSDAASPSSAWPRTAAKSANSANTATRMCRFEALSVPCAAAPAWYSAMPASSTAARRNSGPIPCSPTASCGAGAASHSRSRPASPGGRRAFMNTQDRELLPRIGSFRSAR